MAEKNSDLMARGPEINPHNLTATGDEIILGTSLQENTDLEPNIEKLNGIGNVGSLTNQASGAGFTEPNELSFENSDEEDEDDEEDDDETEAKKADVGGGDDENAASMHHNTAKQVNINDKTNMTDSIPLSRSENLDAYQQLIDNSASKNRGDVAQVRHAAQTNTISYSTGETGCDEIGGATGTNKSSDFDRVPT